MNPTLNRKLQILVLAEIWLTLVSGCSTVRLSSESASKWNSQKAVKAIRQACQNNFNGWTESGTYELIPINVDEQSFDVVNFLSSHSERNGDYITTHSTGKKYTLYYSDIDHVESRYDWSTLGFSCMLCLIVNPINANTVVVMNNGYRIKLNANNGAALTGLNFLDQ